jgi:hypothetical protein
MQDVSDGMILEGIRPRLAKGLDVYDNPAPPLKSTVTSPNNKFVQIARRIYQDRGYQGRKIRRGLAAIRNWFFTGRTIRSMKTLEVSVNRSVAGFTDAEANMRAAINNRRWRQFGLAPSDKTVIAEKLGKHKAVEVVDGR